MVGVAALITAFCLRRHAKYNHEGHNAGSGFRSVSMHGVDSSHRIRSHVAEVSSLEFVRFSQRFSP